MITLRPSHAEELVVFDAMDRQIHAANFVDQIGIKRHREYFDESDIYYLSISSGDNDCAGYFILVAESDFVTVEFRRILIDRTCIGIGQAAIIAMEKFCKKEFDVKRIWLDVYEDNAIGRHIYGKMGYQQFKEKLVMGRKLLFYEKSL